MNKEEIKKIQRMAQKLLEQLQGEEASFLFVGDEGNCFTIAVILQCLQHKSCLQWCVIL